MRRRRRGDDEEQTFAEGAETSPARERLTPVDIQQKVFRLSFRGYNERDVDEFLDQVTEDLAALHEENKRLRESLHDAGGAPAALSGAQGQAEQVVRQAREHAAKLVEDAGRRAAEIGTTSPTPAAAAPATELPANFLTKERDFLKRLAAMVQDHARSLKEEAARTMGSSGGEGETPAPEPSALALAQRAVEAEDREEQPATAPAERMPEESERWTSTHTDTEGNEERNGPWGPASPEPGEAGPGGVAAPDRGEPRDDADPLISAWESAFLAGGPEAGGPPEEAAASTPAPEPASAVPPSPARDPVDPATGEEPRKEGRGEESSLKELFWGEQ